MRGNNKEKSNYRNKNKKKEDYNNNQQDKIQIMMSKYLKNKS